MRIGIDVHHLRLDQRGIYTYIWNTLGPLFLLDSPHTFTMFLYGPGWMNEPNRLAHIRGSLAGAALRHHWDGPTPRLFGNGRSSNGTNAGKWAKRIDRRIMQRLYRRALRFEDRHPKYARFLTWPWHDRSPANLVDVFHHPAGLIFPVHPKANVMTIHDLIPLRDPASNPEATAYFSESYARAGYMDVIIAVSNFTKQDIIERLGIPESTIHVIPEAAHPQFHPIRDTVLIEAVLAKYGIENREYILNLGALEKRKNVVRLIEAYAQVRQRSPTLAHRLVLTGGGDPTVAEEVKRAVVEHGLTDQVTMLGYIPLEDLPIVLSGADLFVFPSLCEGFGLPPLEAMSCGTPVVCSNATSLPEVVGDAGELVDPTSTDEIARSMHRVLFDRGFHQELRDRGLKRALQFTWTRTAELTLAAYEEAWDRWKRRGSVFKPHVPPTEYQNKLREWVLQQTRERMYHGTFTDWPVQWP